MAPSSHSDSESESATSSQHLPGFPESLSPAAVTRVSAAFLSCRDALRSLPTGRDESRREAIGALCNIVRQESLPPERFLVHFKRVLDEIEGFEAISGETTETPRSRLITLAIECYFQSP
jgi:hypothetical protein